MIGLTFKIRRILLFRSQMKTGFYKPHVLLNVDVVLKAFR